MERTILVPLDGSVLAEQALPLAMAIAKASQSRIWVTTVQRLVLWQDEQEKPELLAEARRLAHAESEHYLWDVCLRWQTAGIALDPLVLPHEKGSVADVLTDFIARTHVRLVVMATHGRGGIKRALLGSVADQVMRRAASPVIVVRAGAVDRVQGERVLVPLDGSPLSETVLDEVTFLAARRHQAMTLLQVVTPVMEHLGVPDSALTAVDVVATQAREEQARDYLQNVRERVMDAGVNCATAVVVGGDPAEVILELSGSGEYGMIALATHGRGGVKRLVLGSVADQVVRHAEIPVLIWRHQPSNSRSERDACGNWVSSDSR